MNKVLFLFLSMLFVLSCSQKSSYLSFEDRSDTWNLHPLWDESNKQCPGVILEEDPGLKNIKASFDGKIRRIEYDPEFLKRFPPQYQIHAFYHECAHHMHMHHTRRMGTLEKELEAECEAAREDVKFAHMTPADIAIVVRETQFLAGAKRAREVMLCASTEMARNGGKKF